MSTYYMVATYHYIKTLVQDLSTFFFFMNLLSANGLKEQNLNKRDEHHVEFQD